MATAGFGTLPEVASIYPVTHEYQILSDKRVLGLCGVEVHTPG